MTSENSMQPRRPIASQNVTNMKFSFMFLFIFLFSKYGISESHDDNKKTTIAYSTYGIFLSGPIQNDYLEELGLYLGSANCIFTKELRNGARHTTATITYEIFPIKEVSYLKDDNLVYYSKGVTKTEYSKVIHHDAIMLYSNFPLSQIFLLQHNFAYSINKLLENHNFLVFDFDSRLLYNKSSWKENRVDSWEKFVPDMRNEINMHSYRDGDLIRIITLGMSKYFLPDLVIENVSQGFTQSNGNFINGIAQYLVEGNFWNDDMQINIDLRNIKHSRHKKYLENCCYENAKRSVLIKLKEANLQEGDNDNSLLTLDYSQSNGKSELNKNSEILSTLFGYSDNISLAKSSDFKLLAASKKAKQELYNLKSYFLKPLKTNERLTIKYPFQQDDQTEFMWLDFVKWEGDVIQGVLINTPRWITNIHSGDKINLDVNKIYDYTWYKQDGSTQGNETTKIIEESY